MKTVVIIISFFSVFIAVGQKSQTLTDSALFDTFVKYDDWFEKNREQLPLNGKCVVISKEQYGKTYKFKWLEGKMKNGFRDSTWVGYHENGAKKCEVNFINSKKEGKEIFYSARGIVLRENNYTNGRKTGRCWKKQKRSYAAGYYLFSEEMITDTLADKKWNGWEIVFFENGDTAHCYLHKNGTDINREFVEGRLERVVYKHEKEYKVLYNAPTLKWYQKKRLSIDFDWYKDKKQKLLDILDSLQYMKNIRELSLSFQESDGEAYISLVNQKIIKSGITKQLKRIGFTSFLYKKIPDFIFECDSLNELFLEMNLAEIPAEIIKLKNLGMLDIISYPGVQLGKSMPRLLQLKKLAHLSISRTVENCVPPSIGAFTNLWTLNLDHEKKGLDGKVVPLTKEIYKLKNLHFLGLPASLLDPALLFKNMPDCGHM
ncbi:MAG: hypothetical protein IAF38_22070 [Bacteroidia bacterium]|nr:hypothetical protein [Bacteroidia bacterium]